MRKKSLFLPYFKYIQLAGSQLSPVKIPDVTSKCTRRGKPRLLVDSAEAKDLKKKKGCYLSKLFHHYRVMPD